MENMWKEIVPAEYKGANRIPQFARKVTWSKVSDMCCMQQAWIRTTAQNSTDTARLKQQGRFGRSSASRICATRTCASRHWVSTWSVAWSPATIWTSAHWNLIGHGMTFPPPVLSPSSTLLSISYQSRKSQLDVFSKMLVFQLFLTFLKFYSCEIEYFEARYDERCIRFIHTASFESVVMRCSVQKTRCYFNVSEQ